jgi:hypothetical protein
MQTVSGVAHSRLKPEDFLLPSRSNAYVKEPNIGENFLTLSYSY